MCCSIDLITFYKSKYYIYFLFKMFILCYFLNYYFSSEGGGGVVTKEPPENMPLIVYIDLNESKATHLKILVHSVIRGVNI